MAVAGSSAACWCVGSARDWCKHGASVGGAAGASGRNIGRYQALRCAYMTPVLTSFVRKYAIARCSPCAWPPGPVGTAGPYGSGRTVRCNASAPAHTTTGAWAASSSVQATRRQIKAWRTPRDPCKCLHPQTRTGAHHVMCTSAPHVPARHFSDTKSSTVVLHCCLRRPRRMPHRTRAGYPNKKATERDASPNHSPAFSRITSRTSRRSAFTAAGVINARRPRSHSRQDPSPPASPSSPLPAAPASAAAPAAPSAAPSATAGPRHQRSHAARATANTYTPQS